MSGVEIAVIITGCVVTVGGIISAIIMKVRCKSACCSLTPIEALEHGDPSIKDVPKEASEYSNHSNHSHHSHHSQHSTHHRKHSGTLEDVQIPKIIEDSREIKEYSYSLSA